MSIAGLQSKEPVGAVLTVGTKGANGAPTDRDRFYLKVPDSQGNERVPHPAFAAYNFFPQLGEEASEQQRGQHREREHAKRRNMHAVLVHASEVDVFEWHRKAQKLPAPFQNHSKLPSCTGDGVTAKRLAMVGDKVEFKDIPCPNDLCQFAIAPNERTPPCCKPWARLLFQPVWNSGSDGKPSPLPTPLMKFTTQSWHTVAGLVGMFKHISEQAALLGAQHGVNLYGLPFEMTLIQKSDAEKKSKFPVVRFSPTVTLQEFLIRQAQRVQQLAAGPSYIGLLDAPEQDPDVLLADKATIEPGPMQQPRG